MGKIRKLFKFPGTIYLLTAITFFATDRSDHSLPFREPLLHPSRAVSTIALTVADYKYSLHRLPPASQHYTRQLSEVHLRSASRILKLCESNKGFYIKAGQFVAAMRQVPKEYSSVLSALQDQVVPCDFKSIRRVLISNLGQDLSDIFVSLDEQLIAAASIAQVHHAILRDNREVAIKVQYPGLEHKMRQDTTIMSFLSKSVAWVLDEADQMLDLGSEVPVHCILSNYFWRFVGLDDLAANHDVMQIVEVLDDRCDCFIREISQISKEWSASFCLVQAGS